MQTVSLVQKKQKLPPTHSLLRWPDSHKLLDSCESFQGSRTKPLFANRRGLIIANRRFEALRANRLKRYEHSFLLRVDS